MSKAIEKVEPQSQAQLSSTIEQVLVQGNLATLPVEHRVVYYNRVCESIGLNPLTRPFEYITLNGKLVLYARRDATDQLRKIHGVSITSLDSKRVDDLLVVTAQATDAQGRTDTATGVVNMAGLKGEALANAMMKSETKAKRRVTLSLCGLGLLDETEIPDGENDAPTTTIVQPQRASVAPASQLAAAPEEKTNGNGHYITTDQRKQLYKICVEEGWSNEQVKEILAKTWNVSSSTQITTEKFDEICRFFRRDAAEPFVATDEDVPF